MAQHKHNINELENSYESEKDRQRKALEKKVRIMQYPFCVFIYIINHLNILISLDEGPSSSAN